MDISKLILLLLTGLLGWLLNELSHHSRERIADQRAISRALADLLEVRHQTVGLKLFIDAFSKRLNLPLNIIPIVLTQVEGILPKTDDLSRRYNEAIDVVSATNPLLGFRLRSKDEISHFLTILRQLASQDPTALEAWPQFEAIIVDLVKSPLDEVILDLAKRHGFKMAWKIRKHLATPVFDPADLDLYLEKVKPLLESLGQSPEACTLTESHT